MTGDGASVPLLEARGLTKRFGSFTALNSVGFELAEGEIHALLGENGAGKSTLMNVLSGGFTATGGEIRMRGEAVRWRGPQDAARRGGIAMVHQHFRLVPVFTVAENLLLAAQRSGFGLERRVVERKAAAVSDSLGWRISLRTRVGDLPVGAQQRVEIVKALLLDPAILFFDEPTAVLTPQEADELFAVLRELRGRGSSIVFISHKLAEIKALCDRVTVLRLGEVVGREAVADVSERKLARLMIGGDLPTPAAVSLRAPSGEPVLSLSGLCAPRVRRDDTELRDVDLAVHAGEIVGVAGVDGNGQEELFEALIGLRRITGSAAAAGDGRSPMRLAEVREGFVLSPNGLLRAGVSWIPPDRLRQGLALTQSVERNLLLGAEQDEGRTGWYLSPRRMRERAAGLAAAFDVRAPSVGVPASSLSGGNQQKIVVARALARRPRLLIAASPTRGLDVGAAAYVHAKLMECVVAGAAILLISTEIDEILMLSNRIAVMYEGRIVGIVPAGTARETIGLLMGGGDVPGARANQ